MQKKIYEIKLKIYLTNYKLLIDRDMENVRARVVAYVPVDTMATLHRVKMTDPYRYEATIRLDLFPY